jgi:hypothetical protein
MGTSFVIGKGTKVRIALLPLGSEVEPVPATLTIGVTPIAKDITGDGTITLASALPASFKAPAGSFFQFIAPTTGKSVLVQLKEDAVAGDTDLTVYSIPEAIAAASTAVYPLKLGGRTNADLDRKGKRTSTVDFDSDGYSKGLTTSIENGIKLPGNWLPQDAGFATAEFAFQELRQVYIWLELPRISDAYSKGRIYHGPASLASIPLNIAADGVITGNIEASFEGKPNYTADTPVP